MSLSVAPNAGCAIRREHAHGDRQVQAGAVPCSCVGTRLQVHRRTLANHGVLFLDEFTDSGAMPPRACGNRSKTVVSSCRRCGVRGWRQRSDATYCSAACRQAAYRERSQRDARASYPTSSGPPTPRSRCCPTSGDRATSRMPGRPCAEASMTTRLSPVLFTVRGVREVAYVRAVHLHRHAPAAGGQARGVREVVRRPGAGRSRRTSLA